MLHKYVSSVLNDQLGKYVENLNAEQLTIAVLQG